MTAALAARVALMITGIAVWGWGVRTEDAQLRMIGIALLACSLVLRFFRKRTGD